MRYALFGALLMIGGIAARIEAARHHPHVTSGPVPKIQLTGSFVNPTTIHLGWPNTTYDLVRIGGWALLIFGAVIVLFSLVRELRRGDAPPVSRA